MGRRIRIASTIASIASITIETVGIATRLTGHSKTRNTICFPTNCRNAFLIRFQKKWTSVSRILRKISERMRNIHSEPRVSGDFLFLFFSCVPRLLIFRLDLRIDCFNPSAVFAHRHVEKVVHRRFAVFCHAQRVASDVLDHSPQRNKKPCALTQSALKSLPGSSSASSYLIPAAAAPTSA